MSRKTRSKQQKEREMRASMDPLQRESLEQREREKREKLEQQRTERREQQERELSERLRKKRLKQFKKIAIRVAVPLCFVALIIVSIAVFRPVTTVFSYSDWIDDAGLWKGFRTLDFLDTPDYQGVSVPAEVHRIPDEDVQSEIDYLLSEYALPYHTTDRPVRDGDEVNIDFTGSVDGVEFEGGSTFGMGEDVIIGTTSYIDDFLEQLIGHMPGETIDVEVTFPEDYHEEDLQGKDALFVTTINYISEDIMPELTDDFVAEYLSAEYGWSTAEEVREHIFSDLQHNAVQQYALEHLTVAADIHSVPTVLIDYQKETLLLTYQGYADSYGMDLDDFINMYLGYESADELLEANEEAFGENAQYYLVIQAVAEAAGLSVGDADLREFFAEQMGNDDYSLYEQQYISYAKQRILTQKAVEYIVDNAVLS